MEWKDVDFSKIESITLTCEHCDSLTTTSAKRKFRCEFCDKFVFCTEGDEQ